MTIETSGLSGPSTPSGVTYSSDRSLLYRKTIWEDEYDLFDGALDVLKGWKSGA